MNAFICFLLLAAPPQIRVEAGKTIITQNGTTITLSADGGIKILGPTLDLWCRAMAWHRRQCHRDRMPWPSLFARSMAG